MQLVDPRRSNLSAEETGKLWELIRESRERDKQFFELLRRLRNLLKRGIEDMKKLDTTDKMKVVVNLAHAYVNNVAPTLFFYNPTFRCLPTHPRFEDKCKTWERVLNSTTEKIGFKEEVEKVVLDSVFMPEGWMKWVLNTVDETTTETPHLGPTPWLDKDTPAPVRIAPSQVVVDYASSDRSLEGARFVDIMYWRSLSELRLDKRYSIPDELESGLVSGERSAGARQDPYMFHDLSRFSKGFREDDDFVVLHEVIIYQLVDLKLYKQVVYLLEGADGLLSDRPVRRIHSWEDLFGDFISGYPITRLAPFPVPDSLPVSGLGVWSSMQTAVNWIITRLVNFIDLEKQIVEMDVNKVKDPEKARKAIRYGKAREVVDVNELGAFNVVQNHVPTRTHDKLLDVTQFYLDQVSGVGQNRRGATGIRTATEASLVERGQQIRTERAVAQVAKFLTDNGYLLARMIRSIVVKDQSTEWVLRVAGDTGSVQWLTFAAEDIDWLPELVLEVDSFRKANKQEKIQEATVAWQAGLAYAQATGNVMGLPILFKKVLDSLEVGDTNKIVGDGQDQVALQASELTLLALGQPVEVNETDDHAIHMEVIDRLVNSTMWQQVIAQNPEAANSIMSHYQAHKAALEKVKSTAGGLSSNPYDDLRAVVPTPANLARQETQKERVEVPFLPGTGNQLET